MIIVHVCEVTQLCLTLAIPRTVVCQALLFMGLSRHHRNKCLLRIVYLLWDSETQGETGS